MTHERYQSLLRDLLSRDPDRVRAANREMYHGVLAASAGDDASEGGDRLSVDQRADLALAGAAQP